MESAENITADEIIKALLKDGWVEEPTRGAIRPFVKEGNPGRRRVTIHYHPGKTYGPKLLKDLLDDIGWDEKRLRELKVI